MKVIVGEHKCTIDKTPVNELEVNVTKVEFEFDEKIPASYAKKAFFTQGNISKEVLLESNECDIPNEVLYQKGQVRLGVIAYEVQNGELIERFNPTPTYFPVWEGSLTEADNTEPITSTDKEQIESAIASIQAEQVTQNEGISQNTNDIGALREGKQDKLISGQNIKTINNESLLGAGNLEVITDLSDYYTKGQTDDLLDDKADKSEIPDVSEFITKGVDNLTNYTKTNDMNTAINTAVGNERTSRETSDVALQSQIDAITASSDVVDVVSTYQDLLNYSTTSLTEDDIIKVMQDESHSNAISYFRWQLSTWNYIGSEGPFYTKGETDTLLNNKANVSDIPDLTNYVKNTDYAMSSKGGVIKVDNRYGLGMIIGGYLVGGTVNYNLYNSGSDARIISKGTLENVITGKQLINQTTLEDSQAEQDENIDELKAELERYKLLENALPHTENETASDYVTLNNTAKAPMEIETIPQTSQETTTGKNLFDKSQALIGKNWNGNDMAYSIASDFIKVTANNSYYFSVEDMPNYSSLTVVSFDTDKVYQNIISGNPFTIPSGIEYVKLSIRSASTHTWTQSELNDAKIQLEQGSIATSYEPYTGGIPAPNPDFPMNIHRTTGDNQVKVVGKNLFDKNNANIINGYFLSGGVITASGDNRVMFIECEPNTTYTLQKIAAPSNTRQIGYTNVMPAVGVSALGVVTLSAGATTGTITTGADAKYLIVRYYQTAQDSGHTEQEILDSIQIETGSTATSYTPYEETPYPISLGTKEMFNINNVSDGFVYDESVDKFYINRNIGKVVLNGSEAWNLNQNRTDTILFNVSISSFKNIGNITGLNLISQFFIPRDVYNYDVVGMEQIRKLLFISINKSLLNGESVADFKSWLSTHNTIVVYQLATSTLEEITDSTLISQLRAIKNALSMQGATHIISTSNGDNLPFLIKARAVQNISNS